jgi:GAF domain-containing protein
MSATPDSPLANPEQRIADLERQLAEALERETATAEVLQVINSSPGDLVPVFQAVLDKATTLCDAAFGILWTYDGDRFYPIALHRTPPAFADFLRPHQSTGFAAISGQAGLGAMIDGKPFQLVLDAADGDLYHSRVSPLNIAFVELGGAHSGLIVPLRQKCKLLGAIRLFRQEVRPFTENQIALLQNFATQAVIAMENARLITETREALEHQTATAEVLQMINSSPGDLAPVFEAILEKAHHLCDTTYGSLQLWDGVKFHGVAMRGFSEEMIEFMRPGYSPGPNMPSRSIIEGERIAHCADIAEIDDPIARAGAKLTGCRTMLYVALRKDEALLGQIVAARREVRPFTDKEIALVENFAAQAVIAMENARLITETREALEHQTATAEVLQVINSSPGDLTPVFDAMLEKAMRLCEAAFGVLWTYDGETIKTAAIRGAPAPYAAFLTGAPHPPGHLIARFAQGEPFVHGDAVESQAYRDGEPLVRALVELAGGRTRLGVPLRQDTAIIGLIVLYRQEVRPFTDKQIALLQNFAAQAVIAMENARLLTETREALEQQTAIAEVLRVINSSPGDPQPLFDELVETAARLCETNEAGLAIRSGDGYRYVATRSLDPAWEARVTGFSFTPSRETATGRTLLERRIIHIDDLAADPEHSVPEIVTVGGLRTFLGVPLLREGELLGVLALARQRVERFTDRQIALIGAFADQAVIAMENARLITETREALEQQTATAEVLGVINSSPGDLAPVFDAMLEKAMNLCKASGGALRAYDGDVFRAVAMRGVPVAFAEFTREVRARPDTALGRTAAGERVVHIVDLKDPDGNYFGSQNRREMVELGGIRTALWVAMRQDETLLGTFVLYRNEVRAFSGKEIALVENFAAQAVIAMENARLLGELRQRTEEVAELNRGLEARVADQVDELGRVGRLKRFLAPQLAELIVSQGDENILESHRREIVVVFCDLRGYTAFTETAEPEEVLEFLRQYHGALGPLVSQFEGTLDQFSGDGIMVFFNDPVPCPDPAERAVKMAVAMRKEASKLIAAWRHDGCELGFGVGIAQGYATLGQIGFTDRSGYTAIGTVCNLASRLCAEAKDGQILVSSRVARAVEAIAKLEDLGNVDLKGLRRPVAAFNVVQGTSAAETRPNLTVVVNEPGA